jgi:hypothetical protein
MCAFRAGRIFGKVLRRPSGCRGFSSKKSLSSYLEGAIESGRCEAIAAPRSIHAA